MHPEELKKLAQAVNTGPWHVGANNKNVVYDVGGWGIASAVTYHGRHAVASAKNAQFIAAANPEAVLALISQRDALLAALKGVVKVAGRSTVEFDAAYAAIAYAEESLPCQ